MQTTCPECNTTFRVSQDHLGARRGLVRCGTCNAVFNAYDTLLPELESPPDQAEQDQAALERGELENADQSALSALSEDIYQDVPPAPQLNQDSSETTQDVAERALAEPLVAQDRADSAEAAAADPEPDFEARAEAEVAEVQFASALAPPTLAAMQPDILLQPIWPQTDKPARSRTFWLQVVLVALLAGLLGLQGIYFMRAELAASLPFTRPLLTALCQPLQCSVPLPSQLTQAAIVASTLEHDPDNKSRVHLTVLLVNRTGQTQAWPQIKLTLSDVRQDPVAQKIFPPRVYLAKASEVADGLARNAEREIRLDLDIGNLVAAGYTLSLSYP